MTYESLLIASDKLGLIAKEKDLQAFDGRIKGKRIAVRKTIETQQEKACVLAEELGHYFTSSGDIMNDSEDARKQEHKARMWSYDVQVGLSGIVRAYEAGCCGLYDMADYLNVPDAYLREVLYQYHEKYGSTARYGDYVIQFDPYLEVYFDA